MYGKKKSALEREAEEADKRKWAGLKHIHK